MNCNREDLLLYAVTDRSWLNGETLARQVEKALKGGATFIQLRDKKDGDRTPLDEVKEIRKLCAEFRVPFVIDDDVELAKSVDADGVHVGQDDMAAETARQILGPKKIIGVSAHNLPEALRAQEQGADYLGVGAIYPTNSKANVIPTSPETLRAICQTVSIPVVAIGGLKKHNLSVLAGTGIAGIAVISAIFAAADIERAAADLRAAAEKIVRAK